MKLQEEIGDVLGTQVCGTISRYDYYIIQVL